MKNWQNKWNKYKNTKIDLSSKLKYILNMKKNNIKL